MSDTIILALFSAPAIFALGYWLGVCFIQYIKVQNPYT